MRIASVHFVLIPFGLLKWGQLPLRVTMGFLTIASIVVGANLGGTEAAASGRELGKTKRIMHGIYVPMSTVLPLSLNHKDFSSAANRTKIQTSLQTLAEQASLLKEHGRQRDAGFSYLANSLDKDAQNAYRWYKRGWYREARFTIHNMTDNCVACHSKRQARSFSGSRSFFKDVNIKQLPPLERAQLMLVTRQFDEAMDTYESLFLDPDIDPTVTVMMDYFVDYMKVAIRVKRDLARPLKLLSRLEKRKDIPKHVQDLLANWRQALTRFQRQATLVGAGKKSDRLLAKGRAIMNEARRVMEYPRDRSGLIHYLVGSSLLQEFIDVKGGSAKHRGDDLAEAFYLLGISELLVGRSFWFSEADHDLEMAIRMSPKSSVALKAYALLEEQTIFGYTGSVGTHIPDDVQSRLDDLYDLITKSPKT